MPQQRTLPYIILGMLANEPGLTGRQMADQFETEIGQFWKAGHSQVYPELKRMVDERWISLDLSPTNAKERYYTITDLGQTILNQWILEPNSTPQQKDLFSLKMFFIKDRQDPRIPQLIQEQIHLLNKQLESFYARKEALFGQRQQILNNYGHYLILSRAIARCQTQILWLEQAQLHHDI